MIDSSNQAEQKPLPGSWFRREWRLLAGLSLSVLCLFLAARKISLADVRHALAIARWEWVVLAAVVVVTSTSLKALRWRALFLPQRVRLGRVWSIFMIGQMLNAVFPARAGEVGRIYLIGHHPGSGTPCAGPQDRPQGDEISRATAFSTVVLEKVLDLIMLSLAYLIVAVWLVTTRTGLPDWLRDAGTVLIPLTAVTSCGLLLFAHSGRTIWEFLHRGLQPLPATWQAAANAAAEKTIGALEAFRYGRARTQAWGWSFVIWVLMALTNGLLFPAFRLALSPFVAILLLVVLMSGVAVPPLPGNLGVFVYLCQLVLSLFGTDHETALIYGITLQMVAYLPLIVLGSVCMLWENRSLRHSPPTSNQV